MELRDALRTIDGSFTEPAARTAAIGVAEQFADQLADVWPGDNEVTIDLSNGAVIRIGQGDTPQYDS